MPYPPGAKESRGAGTLLQSVWILGGAKATSLGSDRNMSERLSANRSKLSSQAKRHQLVTGLRS